MIKITTNSDYLNTFNINKYSFEDGDLVLYITTNIHLLRNIIYEALNAPCTRIKVSIYSNDVSEYSFDFTVRNKPILTYTQDQNSDDIDVKIVFNGYISYVR